MSSEYSKEFGKDGHKIGDKMFGRKPQRFEVTDGMDYQGQPLTNEVFPITVDQVSGVHFQWDSIERTLQLDDVMKNFVDPAVTALSNRINQRAAQLVALNTFNQVGTPGTVPSTFDTYLAAGDKLIEQGMPENMEKDLTLIINRKMSSKMVSSSNALFNDSTIIAKQHRDGDMVNQLGYKIMRDQTIYTHTTGSYAGTILVNGANQTQADGNNGIGSIITDGHTSGTSTIKAGDVFQLTGVNSVHPQTRQDTGRLQDFVALTTQLDTAGAMTISMSPAITPSGQYQNVTAAAADNAPLLFPGAASAVSTQGLLMHKNAFAFISVPMVSPGPGEGAKAVTQTDDETGITLSYIKYFDGDKRVHKNRFDVLYGFAPMYREMACRVAS